MCGVLETATLASKKRALELGASFIETDLRQLRTDARRIHDTTEPGKPVSMPVTTSHEGDIMKAMEWASAVTWLRAMAERED